jgi:hypothetical protein
MFPEENKLCAAQELSKGKNRLKRGDFAPQLIELKIEWLMFRTSNTLYLTLMPIV